MNPQICPECGGEESRVIDSRLTKEYRRRRYQCAKVECKHRWNTHEIHETEASDRQTRIQQCFRELSELFGSVK